ncbi:WD40 repeat domain-containing protein [Sphingobacterium psychroaquaticum]|nr:hypothetical protein [Sphingobacterium psychroaquaticum]
MHNLNVSLVMTLTGHQNPIFALENSLDQTMLYSGGNDRGVVEWDLATGKFNRILCAVPASVYALCLLKDSGLLAIGMRNSEIWLVDVDKQQLVKKLYMEKGAVFALRHLEDKKELLAIGEAGVAYVWNLDTYELVYNFRVSNTTVRTIEPSVDGKYLNFGDKDGHVYQLESASFREVNRRKIHSMSITALLATAENIFSGGRDAVLHKLVPSGLSPVQQVTPHLFTVYGILKHPTSDIIITVSRDKSIKFWDMNTLSLLRNISMERGYDSHRLSINTAIYNAASNQLITAGDDKLIKLWRVEIA